MKEGCAARAAQRNNTLFATQSAEQRGDNLARFVRMLAAGLSLGGFRVGRGSERVRFRAVRGFVGFAEIETVGGDVAGAFA